MAEGTVVPAGGVLVVVALRRVGAIGGAMIEAAHALVAEAAGTAGVMREAAHHAGATVASSTSSNSAAHIHSSSTTSNDMVITEHLRGFRGAVVHRRRPDLGRGAVVLQASLLSNPAAHRASFSNPAVPPAVHHPVPPPAVAKISLASSSPRSRAACRAAVPPPPPRPRPRQ